MNDKEAKFDPHQTRLVLPQRPSEITIGKNFKEFLEKLDLKVPEPPRGDPAVPATPGLYVRYPMLPDPESTQPTRIMPVSNILIPGELTPVLEADHVLLGEYARELLGFKEKPGKNTNLRGEVHPIAVGIANDYLVKETAPEKVGRAISNVAKRILGTPSTQLLEMQSLLSDQDQSIVRIPSHIFGIIGVQEGDSVVIEWFNRSIRARAYAFPEEMSNWSEKGNVYTSDDLRRQISLPLVLRRKLGLNSAVDPNANEFGVVTVRRSLLGVQRKQIYKNLTLVAAVFLVLNPNVFDAYAKTGQLSVSPLGGILTIVISLFMMWLTQHIQNRPFREDWPFSDTTSK